jgi:hypothetical protein
MAKDKKSPKPTRVNAVEWWSRKLGFMGDDGGALAARRKKKIRKTVRDAE